MVTWAGWFFQAMDRNYLINRKRVWQEGAGEVPSGEKWGKDSGIMLLLITSIYCAPTMYTQLCSMHGMLYRQAYQVRFMLSMLQTRK